MIVKQAAEFVNLALEQALGKEALQDENLSWVDKGTALFNAGEKAITDYIYGLTNHIGRVVFVERVYSGAAPKVLMDAWTFGSIREKIRTTLPEATENETWSLVNGQSYDPNVFKGAEIHAKFYNKAITFEVDMSITRDQVRQSFSNEGQLNSFVSMIFTSIENSLTVKIDALTMRLYADMIGSTLWADYQSGTDFSGASHNRAVNVLYLYNQEYPDAQLTYAQAKKSPDFWRFFAYIVGVYSDRLKGMSVLFNINGTEKFTPSDRQKWVYLSEAKRAVGVYLENGSGQFNTQNLQLPEGETIPYWQGSGNDYGFDSTSKIFCTTSSGNSVETTGILAVAHDYEAIGITNIDRYVNTNNNGKADFVNYFYKYKAEYIVDPDENFVVFFMA